MEAMMLKSIRSKKYIVLINGSQLLEKSIAFCNGKCNPIRHFSSEEIKKATNNYDENQVLKSDFDYNLYKGFIQDRPVTVKKFSRLSDRQSAIDEIVYASVMSMHTNSLKLLGCCLETSCPILVFESVETKTLADRSIDRNDADFKPVSWKMRVKIASDIANAIVYMHTSFPRPLIHRDIKASNILLSENNVAKLSDYSWSVSIPEGESHVQDVVVGTLGSTAPESFITGQESCYTYRTETGEHGSLRDHVRKYIEMGNFYNIVDPVIVAEETGDAKEQELEAFGTLAIQCTHDSAEERPNMIEVAKLLAHIYQSVISAPKC